jgi:hypothetical protein
MRPLRAATVVLVALAPLAPAPAHAAPPGGLRCGYTTFTDLRDETGRTTFGELEGGPILLDSDPAGQPVWGSLTCTFQLYPNVRHSDADLFRASSTVTPGVAYLAPAAYRLEADPLDPLMLCSQVDLVGRGSLYWDSPTQTWSADPDATCADPWEGEGDPPPDDQIFYEVVDPAVCPPLATVVPPEGDVDNVYDCPPYGS